MSESNNMSKNGISRSAPLQNLSPCVGCSPRAVMQFSSASEVAEYKKRKTTAAYYNSATNMYPVKNRYASIITTYVGAEAQKLPSSESTCCPGMIGLISDGKNSPFFLHNKLNPT
jgi:hypothetical protein